MILELILTVITIAMAAGVVGFAIGKRARQADDVADIRILRAEKAWLASELKKMITETPHGGWIEGD